MLLNKKNISNAFFMGFYKTEDTNSSAYPPEDVVGRRNSWVGSNI